MKICWDKIIGITLNKDGYFRKKGRLYIEKDACIICGESYLTAKNWQSAFCNRSCAVTGKGNPMYGISIPIESRKRISESNSKRLGELNGNYKGGIYETGLASYTTYADRLRMYQEVRKQKDKDVLEVKCVYCGCWFSPTRQGVKSRIRAINEGIGGLNLYCSDGCKESCPIYGKIKYPKGFKKGTSREVSSYLRHLCFERDNWECQKCHTTKNLHCHHISGYTQNKILANDIENVITLCKECHKEVHKQHNCSYTDLKCKKPKTM